MRGMQQTPDPARPDASDACDETRPAGFLRVSAALSERRHGHAPLWLEVAARTSQEAADALGVSLGQIAKSVVFRRKLDEQAVLVIASGDRRVDEKKLKELTGLLGRADANYVKAHTGFSIGGVSPLGFAPMAGSSAPLVFVDRELFRFDIIWAAAGHPNAVFRMTPAELVALTEAPVIDVVQP